MTPKRRRKGLPARAAAPSLAQCDPEGTAGLEVLTAEGVTWDRLVAVIGARAAGREEALSKREQEDFRTLQRDVSHRSGDDPSDEAVIEAYLDRRVLLGLSFDRAGADVARPDGVHEKLAVRAVLGLLATSNPRVLAAAMGVATATLYAYSDKSRTQRPGPERLYRAALYFRFLAFEAKQAADHLNHIASNSKPVRRGRRPSPSKREDA